MNFPSTGASIMTERLGIGKVGLSVAHYARRPGAGFNGVYENELSARWTESLAEKLKAKGIQVVLAPAGKLRAKVGALNSHDLDMVVEIHFNGSSNPKVAGVESLFCPRSFRGKILADVVHASYAPVMQCRDRGVKEGWYRMDRPYVIDFPGDIDGDEHPDYFLAKTTCPALILEPDFMSQRDNINNKQEDACQAIAEGIATYLERSVGTN